MNFAEKPFNNTDYGATQLQTRVWTVCNQFIILMNHKNQQTRSLLRFSYLTIAREARSLKARRTKLLRSES